MQWVVCSGSVRESALQQAWFFFELMVSKINTFLKNIVVLSEHFCVSSSYWKSFSVVLQFYIFLQGKITYIISLNKHWEHAAQFSWNDKVHFIFFRMVAEASYFF